jgi:hypothetical protein
MPLHAILCQPESLYADSRRRAFEVALADVLARVPGTWTARISRDPSSWTVTVERAVDGCRRTLVLAPHEHTLPRVTAELMEALRDLE